MAVIVKYSSCTQNRLATLSYHNENEHSTHLDAKTIRNRKFKVGSAQQLFHRWRRRICGTVSVGAGFARQKPCKFIGGGASNLHSDEDMEEKIKLSDPRVQKLIRTYLDVFGQLPPPDSCDKLVQMGLKLKPEFVGHRIRRRPYPAPKKLADEIERQIQECIDAGLVLEYKDGDYPKPCSPLFPVAKPGSTAKRLVVDYGELDKKPLNRSESIPNMESTLEKIASCRYKTKMNKRSGFWQVDLTSNAQELLAFITPQVRGFKWKVMPFGVANTPALFQELMNKILSILRRGPVVQELLSRGAQMEAHINDVCLGTNTQEDHLILLGEFFAVCQENHTRLKLEKCEFI